MRKPYFAASVLILLLLLFIAAGATYIFWKNYEDTQNAVRARAASASQVVAANVGWAFETARQVLRRVDDSLGPDIAMPRAGAEANLSEAVQTLPGSVKVYVVDGGGATRLTTDPDFKPIDVRDREYFSSLAAGEQWHTSSMLVSRLNGEQIFTVSKRLERNGAFAGAAILSFNSSLMQSVWESLNFDPQSTVGLFRDDGLLVSRYPPPDGPMDLSKYVLFIDYLPKAAEGVYEAVSPADGVHRTVGYRRVPGTNLVALASVSNSAGFAAFNAATASLLALAIPSALLLAAMAFWAFRVLRADALERQREAQFRVFAEAMPNHVWTSQPNGLLDWFNSQVYQYSGAKEGQLDGTKWSSIVHPDDIDQAARLWTSALKTGSQYETQFRIRRADGAYRWHLVRSVPILDANSKVLRWIGTNTDIEDQKRVADQLAESDARLRLAIEAGQLAVWELDVPNLRITPSRALNRLYGFPEDAEPTLVEYQSRYAPGELERIGKLNAEAIARGQAELEVEVRHLWPDGTEKWLLIRSQTIGPVDAPSRAIGVVIDITARKRIEQALSQSERRFRLSQYAAGIASLELDIATGMVMGSERFWEIWGLSPRESVHISVLEGIVVPEDKDIRSTPETREEGTAVPNVEYRIKRPDTGELRWLSRHIEFIHDETGKPTKMFGIMQDITELKDVQAHQQMLTHELEHRIKNILAIVQAIASQTLRDTDINSAREAFGERIRALANAHDILTRSQWTQASLRQVVEDAVEPLPGDRVRISGKDLTLQPRQALSMALAVHELGTNALKYGALSGAAGRVEVSWRIDTEGQDDRTFVWRWLEIGGPPVVPPSRRGFGSFLVQRVLGADFQGDVRIDYHADGVEVVLTASMSVLQASA